MKSTDYFQTGFKADFDVFETRPPLLSCPYRVDRTCPAPYLHLIEEKRLKMSENNGQKSVNSHLQSQTKKSCKPLCIKGLQDLMLAVLPVATKWCMYYGIFSDIA